VRDRALFVAVSLLILAAAACSDDSSNGSAPSVSLTTSPLPDPGPCLPNLEATPPAGGLTWQGIVPDPIPAPEGWSVKLVEGEGPFLSVSDGSQAVGTVELLTFPIASLTDPPFDPQRGLGALQDWAETYYDLTREGREQEFGEEYVFEQDEPEPGDAGGLCAVRYAFRGTMNGEILDRVVGHATYDSENLYLFVTSYDSANAAAGQGFLDPEALEAYAPFLGRLVAGLRLPA
jgi:hypothetical protein